ncbi:hypothetical protein [Pseudomonas sp. MWU13-3659]|uniref:hypothetical protein n=1 Tax=Pseudomonas sp. MWU13-3659 TaxID=2986964 RepID=UPI00207639F5|nr:hypothetical protein [Pseudomonas sp. MWU13-3659]
MKTIKSGTVSITYPAIDWEQIGSMQLRVNDGHGQPGTWDASFAVKAARLAEEKVLALAVTAGADLQALKDDKDLNHQAKARRAGEIGNRFHVQSESMVTELDSAAGRVLSESHELLSPVKQLQQGDVVGELKDQEVRAYVRSLTLQDRNELIARAAQGLSPQITQAILRGLPELSGVSQSAQDRLELSGIAANHSPEILKLRELATAFSSVLITVSQAGRAVLAASGIHGALVGDYEALAEGTKNTRNLRSWAGEIPAYADRAPENSSGLPA